ncbi:MAG: redoxin domain-containing protein [Treponema sp.]|jgi:cytochrome c-type biogenesis protein|nr:redoxin domain-containing protein [Treponema sp.]
MSENISVLLAFGAGLLSFLSPCVLPLIPSYLCIIGGIAPSYGTPVTGTANSVLKPRLVAGTVSFILGFSAVFVVLSIIFAVTFNLMGGVSRYINWISGAVVIVLGLNIIFDFISFLNYEKRFQLAGSSRGIAGAFLAGAAFGAGWTPCVGPVLTGILLLAAQSGGVPRAALYLTFYSAGLGLPFLLASLFFNAFVKTSQKLRPHLPLIRRISGALLVVIGILIVTGRYQALNAFTAKWQNNLLGGSSAVSGTASANNEAATGETANTAARNEASTKDAKSNTVPAAVIQAFKAAGIPVVAEGIEPVDFSLPLLSGTNQRLSDLRGKVVFLNFWATWCGPCRMEMPSMEAVYQRLKDQGFAILAVNVGESRDQVAPFMRETKLSFPAALDEKGIIGGHYGVQALPTTYILDRRGLIVARMVGSIDWNQPGIIAAFESLLAN